MAATITTTIRIITNSIYAITVLTEKKHTRNFANLAILSETATETYLIQFLTETDRFVRLSVDKKPRDFLIQFLPKTAVYSENSILIHQNKANNASRNDCRKSAGQQKRNQQRPVTAHRSFHRNFASLTDLFFDLIYQHVRVNIRRSIHDD